MNKLKLNIRIISSVLLMIFLILMDQLSKYLVLCSIKGKKDIKIIKNILSFTYLENNGAAWSILSGKTCFLSIITVIVLILIFFMIIKLCGFNSNNNNKITKVLQYIFVFLAAGALGNLIDRIRYQYVIDFIKAEFITFPIFNIADCYVTVSAVLLVIILIFFVKEKDIDNIFKGGRK